MKKSDFRFCHVHFCFILKLKLSQNFLWSGKIDLGVWSQAIRGLKSVGDIVFSVLQVRAHDIIHNLLKWSILLILVQYVLHRIARLLKSCKPAPMSERLFSMTRSLVCIKSSQKSNLRVCTVKSPQHSDEIVANFKNLVRLLTFPYTKLFTQTLYQSLVLLKTVGRLLTCTKSSGCWGCGTLL